MGASEGRIAPQVVGLTPFVRRRAFEYQGSRSWGVVVDFDIRGVAKGQTISGSGVWPLPLIACAAAGLARVAAPRAPAGARADRRSSRARQALAAERGAGLHRLPRAGAEQPRRLRRRLPVPPRSRSRPAPQREPPLGADHDEPRAARLGPRALHLPPMIAVLPHTSDAQLVAAYRHGDRSAFDAIHTRYTPRLERFAHKILARSAPGVAEDVVQEAMLRASRALLRDEREIDLKPWLFRLTRNCALDELSRVKTDSVALDDEDSHVFLAAPAVDRARARASSAAPACASCSRTSRRCPRSSATRCCGASSTARATRRSPASSASARVRPRASSSAPARTSCASARRAPRTARRCGCSCSKPPTRTGARSRRRCATSPSARPAASSAAS